MHLIFEIFQNSILITGLVTIMMMMIECFNVWSQGRFTGAFKRKGFGQIVLSAFLGAIPGCMGGFAVVSMYTHGLVSFGALIAMMIASSGDESFVMLAMIPDKVWWIFLSLFAFAVICGFLTDLFVWGKAVPASICSEGFEVHEEETEHERTRHLTWKRILLFTGVTIFIACLAGGFFEGVHEHGAAEATHVHAGINLLSEDWMNVMFAIFSLLVLAVLVFAGDHFVSEHLWNHIVVKHLPTIFAWTSGVLAVIAVMMHYVDISTWISDNTALMILLAAAIGLIPESGPHMVFVTMYAAGIVPLPVLISSCISQDGHAGIPLLAENKRAFLKAKTINMVIALLSGYSMMLIL